MVVVKSAARFGILSTEVQEALPKGQVLTDKAEILGTSVSPSRHVIY